MKKIAENKKTAFLNKEEINTVNFGKIIASL